ncbi:hypothetical protein LEP1GSC047_3693 [Leptospira inadai serovar Lyme str. 10]|uniref:Uncharacterized protein n=1 Tax=Leptospira inadai serovar Lyme str. 10 TaxID=1049790 RepID=V6HE40_9LEPT|nr:hypothetical protein LEP1GSC047_3693 [Leptospira inadai serovar Lyme str. 10]
MFEDFLGEPILDWKVIIILVAGFTVGVLYGLWVKKRNPKS